MMSAAAYERLVAPLDADDGERADAIAETDASEAQPSMVEQPPQSWGAMRPLVEKTCAHEFPLQVLPPVIRAAVEEVQAFVQAPKAQVANAALAAISVAAQATADVARAEGLVGPCSVFLLTIAESGERKTTCDRFFSQAIAQWELDMRERWMPEVEAFKASLDAWEAERAGLLQAIKELRRQEVRGTSAAKPGARNLRELKRDLDDLQMSKPQAPRVPRLLLADETPEHLAWTLAKDWPSAGILTSEGGLVLGSHGMGTESALRNLAQLNTLWDGQRLSVGRRSVESFVVENARLTMSIQIQEAALNAFFERTGELARGTGFLARFLIASPESTQGQRPFRDAPAEWPALAAYSARLRTLLDMVPTTAENGALLLPILKLTAEAKAHWVAYHDEVEAQLSATGELAQVRDVASKSADNAARLATLLRIFVEGPGPIELPYMEAGTALAAWFLSESRRLLGTQKPTPAQADAARLEHFVVKKCRAMRVSTLNRSQVMRDIHLDAGRLTAALQLLEAANRCRTVERGRTAYVEVHPDLLEDHP